MYARNNTNNNNPYFSLQSGTFTLDGVITPNVESSYYETCTFTMADGSGNATLILKNSAPWGSDTDFDRSSGWGSGSAASSASYNINLNGTASTVTYNRSGNQTINRAVWTTGYGPVALTYRNLTLAGSGNKSLPTTSTATVTGTLSIQGTAAMTNKSPTYGASSILEYKGSAAQTSTSIEFPSSSGPPNLRIDNSSGVTLNEARTISGTLTLTSGILITTSTNSLTLSSSSTGAVSGGSSSSYVNGPLDRTLAASTNYSFPVGGNSSNYRPISLNSVSVTGNPVVRVTVSETGATTVDNSTLTSLLNARNWRIEQISGTFTSATLEITESAMTNGTHEIGKSNSNQAGTYVSCGTPQTVSSGAISSPSAQGAGFYAIGVIYSCSPLTSAGSVTADQTICSGGDPTAFSSTAVASGGSGGTITYQWESSTTSSSSGYGDISGATSATYDAPSGLTTTTYYRRKSKRCNGSWEQTTSAITVTVNASPTSQASSMAVSNLGTTTLTLSWTRGNGSGIAVFAKANTNTPSDPTSGTTYTANTAFGSGNQIGSSGWFCVYNGTGTSVNITGLTGGNTYNFAAYEYSSTTCYNMTEATLSANTYCTLNNSNQTTYKITSFSTSGGCTSMSNTSTRTVPAGCLIDYTGSYSTSHDRSSTVSFSMASSHGSSYAIWVDWNIDGDFADAGENVYLNTSTSNSSINSSFSVPATATIGTTRMRVGIDYSYPLSASMQCGSNDSYSQYEDYSFVINAAGSTQISVGGTATATASPICSGSSTTVSLSGNTGTIQWQQSSNGSTGWTNVTGGSGAIIATYTTPTLTATTYYRAMVTSGACTAANSSTATITVTAANTAGAASSTPTLCINTALTAITHATTGATGIGAATGLPTGVTAAWASNTITISGTPTASGTFNYSIPLTGGCGSVNATGTITVTAANTAGAASSTPTLCINTALTAITHATTGATGIGTATGLPSGVTAAWVSNTITISGTPTASGTFNYSIPLTGGCGSVNATGTITVTAPTLAQTISPLSGDYVWQGSANGTWANATNWLSYNGSSYVSAGSSPNDPAIRIFIPDYSGVCATYDPIIVGTLSTDNITITDGAVLTISSGATLNLSGSLSNAGTLAFTAAGTINIEGAWVNNGTFNAGTGTVVFNGTTNASIVSGTNSFYNLSLNGGSALEVTLTNAATVSNTLTLTSGNIVLGTNNLTIASSGAISGGSSSSFVVTNSTGILKQISINGSSAAGKKVFPIGLSASSYTPMILANAGTSDDFSARVVSGVLQSGTTGTAITSKYVDRTWLIDETVAGGSDATLTLGWNAAEEQGQFNRIACFVTHYTGGAWDVSTATSASGTPYTTFRSGITSFSPFSVTSTSALPIELISFQANCANNKTVDVTWSTATEHNSYYFRVDKSRDGIQWDVLGTIGAAGHSTNVIDYALTDIFPAPGINYYRLTQYDVNGSYEMFDIYVAVCKDQQSGTVLSVFPNPSLGDFNVELQTEELEGEATLMITDAKGAVVHSQDIKVIKGANNYLIQRFEADPGIYYIIVELDGKRFVFKHSAM
jgi:hypothetical protein